MGCRTTTLMVIVAVFLLALDHSVAHARQVRSLLSMSTGEHASTKEEVLQATSRKHGGEHTKGTETVHMEKGSSSTGEGVVGGRVEPSFGLGGNNPASAEKVVVVREGPRPHPKKHN